MTPGSVLFVNARVYCPSVPFASSVLVHNGRIAWVGDDSGAQVHRELAETIIECGGGFLAPAFVDAHVHATSTGLLLNGLDLSQVANKQDLLDLLSKFSRHTHGAPVIGHGWDQSTWTDMSLPSRAEIDRASWGSEVYLSRIDVHSALVSSALVARAPESRALQGFGDFAVTATAHERLRTVALNHLNDPARARAHIAFFDHALSQGIGSVHEMAGPAISSQADAKMLGERSRTGLGPHVFTYWGQLASDGGIDVAREIGAMGVGGDLFVDGALGSRTAALRDEYNDSPGNTGVLYVTPEEIAAHVGSCIEADYQSGFHVIGDLGMDTVLSGYQLASQSADINRLRQGRHRLEHAELIAESHHAVIKDLHLVASMQPLFDALWGGEHGMYRQRLGERSSHMNQWGSLLSQGVSVCFSSDAPVTDVNPWAAIHAAMFHHNPAEQITARAAFSAHTRAGWRALGGAFDGHGIIDIDAHADLALWRVDNFAVQVPDQRVTQWSTDPRSATVPLPDLGDATNFQAPQCLLTMVNGRILFRDSTFDGFDT